MPAPTWRCPIFLLVVLLLLEIVCTLTLVAAPFLLLLLLPFSFTREIYEWVIDHVMAVIFAIASFLIRVGTGIRVFLHCEGGPEELLRLRRSDASILLSGNHRTDMCWAWFWGLGVALHRLRGYKIVMGDFARCVPLVGWITQMVGMVYIDRGVGKKKEEKNSEAQLDTLQLAVKASSGRSWPLCLQIFPEGRDLNSNSIKASNEYADKQGLPHYTEVLHPKTKGFEVSWLAFQQLPTKSVLIDASLAFVDYAKGEIPTFKAILLGRCPSEIHVAVDIIKDPPTKEGLDALCKGLFRKKEERLVAWYDSETLEGRKQNLARFLGYEPGEYIGIYRSNRAYFLYCIIFTLVCEAIVVATFWFAGWLALLGTLAGMTVIFAVATSCGGLDTYVRWHAKKFPRAGVLQEKETAVELAM